jgi:hypothetical protein
VILAPDILAERRAINRAERTARFCPFCFADDCARSPAVLMPFVADRALGWAPTVIDESWGLNTIPAGRAYSICNSVQCGQCGGLFLDIRFTDDELGRLYRDYRGADYTALRERYEPDYRARNDALKAGVPYLAKIEAFLRPHVPMPVRVLDWGGDTGKNSPFQAEASTFHIHDISRMEPVAGASFVERHQIDPDAYDLIVCSNVLEHIPHPLDLLDDIVACMGEHTLFYLEVPYEAFMLHNQANPDRLAAKRHWHEHVNFFTQASLERLCVHAGLEVIESALLPVPEPPSEWHLFQLACRWVR